MTRSAAVFFTALVLTGAGRADETAPPSPPLAVVSGTFAAANSSKLEATSGPALGHQSEFEGSLTWLERRPFGSGPWYYGGGLESQQYGFGGMTALGVNRLQELTGVLSVEYFLQGEAVAAVSVRPGLYSDGYGGTASWDAPVQAFSGIPLTDALAGVVGGSDGRLFHHPIPIVGLVWTIAPGVRLEAVYPEPAVVLTLRRGLEFRLGGELTGDGFLVTAGSTRTRLEYYSYRVMALLTAKLSSQAKVTFGAGAEVERVFDFYEIGRRFHARPAASVELGFELAR